MHGQDRLLPTIQRRAFHDDAFVDCRPFAGDPDGYVNYAQTARCAVSRFLNRGARRLQS